MKTVWITQFKNSQRSNYSNFRQKIVILTTTQSGEESRLRGQVVTNMNKKALFILISLSLLSGIGLAGGLYLVSIPSGPLTRAEIISALGQNLPRADLNADGK
jgi:hypothetical protein